MFEKWRNITVHGGWLKKLIHVYEVIDLQRPHRGSGVRPEWTGVDGEGYA